MSGFIAPPSPLAAVLLSGNTADATEISGGNYDLVLNGGPIDSNRGASIVGAVSSGIGQRAQVIANAAHGATNGRVQILTDASTGDAGQFLSFDTNGCEWVSPLVRHAAGVPAGMPTTGELPFAVDTTASPGTLYFWDGAAWARLV